MRADIGRIIPQLMRTFAAVVLFIAAVSKVFSHFRDDRLSLRLAIDLLLALSELGLAFWLARSGLTLPTWSTVSLAFLAFFLVSVHKELAHDQTCGCFGAVSIRPKTMALFDLSMLVALGVGARSTLERTKLSALLYACPTAVAIGTASLMLARPGTMELRVIEPGALIGTDLLSAQIIDPSGDAEPLRRGQWVLLLYHADCDVCMRAMREFRVASLSGRRSAIVEVPSGGQAQKIAGGPSLLQFRLTDKYNWYVQTPLFLALDNGRVTRASQRLGDVTMASSGMGTQSKGG